jgi:hypothetical protein
LVPLTSAVESDPRRIIEYLEALGERLTDEGRMEEHPFLKFLAVFPGGADNPAQFEERLNWLKEKLDGTIKRFDPEGWFVCECQLLDSSYAGKRYTLPYGGNSTHLAPPSVPFSPSGQRAADTAVVIATLTREQYGQYLEASR